MSASNGHLPKESSFLPRLKKVPSAKVSGYGPRSAYPHPLSVDSPYYYRLKKAESPEDTEEDTQEEDTKEEGENRSFGRNWRDHENMSIEERRELADATLKTNTTGGLLADYFAPGRWGSERAGRATTLARAAGYEPAYSVTNPLTSGFISSLVGAGLGGGIGALGGGLLGIMNNGRYDRNANQLAALGGLAGAGIGGVGGYFADRADGRRQYDMLKELYALEGREPNVLAIDPNSFLSPWGATHRKGQVEAAEYLANKDARPPGGGLGTNLGYLGAAIGDTGAGPLGTTVHGLGTGVYADMMKDDLMNAMHHKKSSISPEIRDWYLSVKGA